MTGNSISATNTYFNTMKTILVGDTCTLSELAHLGNSEQESARPQPARPQQGKINAELSPSIDPLAQRRLRAGDPTSAPDKGEEHVSYRAI
jgi:hypothetical protein